MLFPCEHLRITNICYAIHLKIKMIDDNDDNNYSVETKTDVDDIPHKRVYIYGGKVIIF